jgi:F0F1-type ATP synthase epsilon subunit
MADAPEATAPAADAPKPAASQPAKPALGKDGKPLMYVKVHSPLRVYFSEQAMSVSAQNATGPFDVLPHHHNFITILTPCELVVRTERGETRIRISGGIMHVRADRAVIFLDV